MNDWLPGIVAGLITIMGSYFVARLGSRAQDTKTAADKEIGSGELAFSIAKDLRYQVARMEDHNSVLDGRIAKLRIMWWQHNRWDEALLTELAKAGVDVSRLPPKPDLTFD